MTETQARNDLQERVSTNKMVAEVDYQAIRSNQDLTEEARLRQLGEAHSKAVERHQKLVAEYEAEERSRRAELEQEVFSPPSPGRHASMADKSQHYISLRDALSKADAAAERDAQSLKERKQSNHLSVLLQRARCSVMRTSRLPPFRLPGSGP